MMPTASSATLHTSPRVAVFIDGLNAMHRLKERHWEDCFDVGHFAERITGGRTLVGVFYFRARPRKPPIKDAGELARQQVHIRNIENQLFQDYGRWLRFGRMKLQSGTWVEKRTDVWLAAQMIHEAATDQIDVAILVTADSDLVPAVELVRFLDKEIELVVFPGKKPNVSELLSHASAVRTARQSWFQPY